MKKLFPIAVLILVLFSCCHSLVGQNFYWSTSSLGEGAIEGDLVVNPAIGESTTAFLYYAPDNSAFDSFNLDVRWDNLDVAAFTGAGVPNFDVTIVDIPVDTRWGTISNPDVTNDTVAGLSATDGFGIEPGLTINNPFVDTGYDFDAESYLLLSIDFERIGPGAATLELQNEFFLSDGSDIGATFASLQIAAIPEPSSAGVLMMGLLFAGRQRIRKSST